MPALRLLSLIDVCGLQMTDNNLSGNNCDGHCFDLRMQEPSCQDDLHVEEEVPWLVLEAGTWFTDGKSCSRCVLNAIGTS